MHTLSPILPGHKACSTRTRQPGVTPRPGLRMAPGKATLGSAQQPSCWTAAEQTPGLTSAAPWRGTWSWPTRDPALHRLEPDSAPGCLNLRKQGASGRRLHPAPPGDPRGSWGGSSLPGGRGARAPYGLWAQRRMPRPSASSPVPPPRKGSPRGAGAIVHLRPDSHAGKLRLSRVGQARAGAMNSLRPAAPTLPCALPHPPRSLGHPRRHPLTGRAAAAQT